MLGLVGSVCAGKSTATDELERLGAQVHRADRHVHELLERDDVVAEAVAALGAEILGDDGRVDRRRLGARVFADEKALRALEGILHPRTGERIRSLIAESRNRSDAPVLVIDAPLLVETGRHTEMDRLLAIDAPEERRAAWAQAARGWDRNELARRDARLMPIGEKKKMADFIIENDGSREDLIEQVRRLWRQIT